MIRIHRQAMVAAMALLIQSCNGTAASKGQDAAATDAGPISVKHGLGTTIIPHRPSRVAALDMNEIDMLDQLGIPVSGMPKDFVPPFLAGHADDAKVEDLGSIVQPNLERVHAMRPDLILITPLQANHYPELSQIAPTVQFDVDFKHSGADHIRVVQDHLATLGRIFGKEDLARQKSAELGAAAAKLRAITEKRPERALILMHNQGAFASLGVNSRYGFIFQALGVKSASPAVEAGLHGQPVSSEFIRAANPDILYIIDRTAVMEHRSAINADSVDNPLLRQTKAWKNGHVVFVDPQAWYVMAASPTSLKTMMADVLRGYGKP